VPAGAPTLVWPISSLPSWRVRPWRLAPLTAQELLAALASLPGSRAVPGDGEIAESQLVAGIEVARTDVSAERDLRRLWRTRYDGGPTPLLLLTDAGDQTARALGPIQHEGPIRVIGTDELQRVFERLTTLDKLEAVRELAQELDRLDRTGVSGLQVRNLGTQHLFTDRLRRDARWAELEELARDVPSEWRALVEQLGYRVEKLQVRNYALHADGTLAALVRPLADAAAFSKLDAEGRPPEGVLIQDCLDNGAPYGILASRGRIRIFQAKPATGSAVASYLELDAEALSGDDRPLLGLLAPEYLAGNGFEALMQDARDFGAKLRKRIDKAIRHQVLPKLAPELGRWAEQEGIDVRDDAKRAELEAAALTFVFRALFLLYAESARHLPIDNAAYRPHSFTEIVRDAAGSPSPRSTTLWDRIKVLVSALREGEDAWLVPAYNGALFAADGFEGAEVLERAALRNEALAPALVALGIDDETDAGFDFSTLEIGHLGHIYEGLLSFRLSVADRPYRYDTRRDQYVPASEAEAEVETGDLLWLTDEGGRKGGGVYYTPEPLVRHLVRRGVVPAFERHLEEVERIAERDPGEAARRLLEFRVLDPACGSAHFLVAVVDELADTTARFLARRPLPAIRKQLDDLRAGAGATYGVGIEDVALLKRLVLKHCVYGVDLSPMGAEIAKISLWLASFVPGLSLAYLDHNVRIGNSLIGVADLAAAEDFAGETLRKALEKGAAKERELLEVQDRTPDEVERSSQLEQELLAITEDARRELSAWIGQENAFHWPLEFPHVFRDGGGFDAVVGNPPWEKVIVEEDAFYGRYSPGFHALPDDERERIVEKLVREQPNLVARLEVEKARAEAMRQYFLRAYEGPGTHPDLFKLFCQRYKPLLRPAGWLAVVLPRSAFVNLGSKGIRAWLFGNLSLARIDFLLNRGLWMFDTHPQYTVALVTAEAVAPPDDYVFRVAGVAASYDEFEVQSRSDGLQLARDALGPALEVPLLPSQASADLLARLRRASGPFPLGGGRWTCFGVQELNETKARHVWRGNTSGAPVWKGESFDQYNPHGAQERYASDAQAALNVAKKPNPGAGSLVANMTERGQRVTTVEQNLERPRVAYRRVTRATDSRTARAALVPKGTFLTDSAPYLAILEDEDDCRAVCLAVLNSLPFDWQARRFVETHLDFFMLEGLRVPRLDDRRYERIARTAARLSCPDERFADFAAATGVEVGPLEQDERDELRAEIDALVGHAYGLSADDLETIFDDFTLDAVSEAYRDRVRERFRETQTRPDEPDFAHVTNEFGEDSARAGD
jgi:hypothetical protein